MSENKLIITPQTRIGELLDTYPQLEEVLFRISPSFAKLKNPILRKTVARVATLQQAAMVGNLKVDELVNTLRKETGQEVLEDVNNENNYLSVSMPDWFNEARIKKRLDAIPIINSGQSPMAEILSLAQELKNGDILELKTPFIPAPIIDKLKDKGFECVSQEKNTQLITYIIKK